MNCSLLHTRNTHSQTNVRLSEILCKFFRLFAASRRNLLVQEKRAKAKNEITENSSSESLRPRRTERTEHKPPIKFIEMVSLCYRSGVRRCLCITLKQTNDVVVQNGKIAASNDLTLNTFAAMISFLRTLALNLSFVVVAGCRRRRRLLLLFFSCRFASTIHYAIVAKTNVSADTLTDNGLNYNHFCHCRRCRISFLSLSLAQFLSFALLPLCRLSTENLFLSDAWRLFHLCIEQRSWRKCLISTICLERFRNSV